MGMGCCLRRCHLQLLHNVKILIGEAVAEARFLAETKICLLLRMTPLAHIYIRDRSVFNILSVLLSSRELSQLCGAAEHGVELRVGTGIQPSKTYLGCVLARVRGSSSMGQDQCPLIIFSFDDLFRENQVTVPASYCPGPFKRRHSCLITIDFVFEIAVFTFVLSRNETRKIKHLTYS